MGQVNLYYGTSTHFLADLIARTLLQYLSCETSRKLGTKDNTM